MSLYNKYRPATLEEVYGNEDVVVSLESKLEDLDKTPHSMLFTGPTGCGKTTLARIVATELGCSKEDFKELDSAQFRGIDTIREVRKQSSYLPLNGDVRVWVLDECHKLSNDAQNALLKILEDTPAHVYFLLCTTDPQKLIATIRNRCVNYVVKPLSEREIIKLLIYIAKEEEMPLKKEVAKQIAADSLGHPRMAIQILEQVIDVAPEKQLTIAKKAAEEQSQSIELCRAMVRGAAWKEVRQILNGLKEEDPENIRRHVLGYCQTVLLGGKNDFAAAVMEEFIEPFYSSGFPGLVYACYTACNA